MLDARSIQFDDPIIFQAKGRRGLISVGIRHGSAGDNEPAIILKDTSKFPDSKPTIWFVVDNVQEEYKRLSAKGLRFLSEPFEIHTGMAAEFEDPFGNRLGITDYSKTKR